MPINLHRKNLPLRIGNKLKNLCLFSIPKKKKKNTLTHFYNELKEKSTLTQFF